MRDEAAVLLKCKVTRGRLNLRAAAVSESLLWKCFPSCRQFPFYREATDPPCWWTLWSRARPSQRIQSFTTTPPARARIAATAEILLCTHWDANVYCSSAQICSHRNLLSVTIIEDAVSPVIMSKFSSSAWFSLVLLITAQSKHASTFMFRSLFNNTYIYKCLSPVLLHSTVSICS